MITEEEIEAWELDQIVKIDGLDFRVEKFDKFNPEDDRIFLTQVYPGFEQREAVYHQEEKELKFPKTWDYGTVFVHVRHKRNRAATWTAKELHKALLTGDYRIS